MHAVIDRKSPLLNSDADRHHWDRSVKLTIASGERMLAPIEKFISKRSLTGGC